MRKTIAALLILFVTSGCTAQELANWVSWYEKDPVAATEFSRLPEIQALLHSDPPEESQRWSTNWDRIAQCESGGNWSYPPVTNRTGTYTGGLMIWTKAWDAYGGEQFASDAYLTSKANQIVIAERIWADRGSRAWDCA